MTTPKTPQNPYLDARREWNERYGDYISSAYQWRLTALLALSAAVIAIAGSIYLATQNHFIPYIVAVDKLGQAVAVQPASQMKPTDVRVVKAQLARFIVNTRSVMADVSASRRAIHEAYAYVKPNSAAAKLMIEYLETNPPLKRAAFETVTPTILSVLPISDKTWQIEWEESVRARNGNESSRARYKAAATIGFHQVDDEETLMKNPVGLYIEELHWTKQL